MNLITDFGSPNSPSSPDSRRGTPTAKQSFLPPYLLGSSQTPVRLTAASSLKHAPATDTERSSGHRVTWSPELIQPKIIQQPRPLEIHEHFTHGGPPTRSLSSDDETSSVPVGSKWQNISAVSSTSKDFRLNYEQQQQQQQSVVSASQVDPFYTQGEDFDPVEDLDECCVTVFGFPAQSASYILQEFAQYGIILNYEIASNCNWMHLRYQSRLQAKKAVSKNTKIFNGTVQIGVTVCIDKAAVARLQGSTKKIPDSVDKTKRLQETNLTFVSSSFASNSFLDTSSMSRSQNPKASMRPLTSAYTSPTSSTSVKASIDADDKDKEGLINKAWQYVFGW